MNPFFRLLSFAKPYGRYLPKYILFTLVATILGTVNFAMIYPVLKVLFEGSSAIITEKPGMTEGIIPYCIDLYNYWLSNFTVQYGDKGALIFVIIILLIATLLANLFGYLSQRTLVSMRTNVVRNIRKAVYDKICRFNVGYFQDKRKGDILSSVSADVTEVQASVVNSFQVLFREPLMIIVTMGALFYMSYRLTLFTLLAIPVVSLLIGRIIKKLRTHAKESQHIMGQIVSVFEETISGIKIIKAFNAEKQMTDRFDRMNSRHRLVNKKIMNRIELASPLSEFLGVSVVACIIFYAGMLQIKGNLGMSMGVFLTYIAIYYRVIAPAKALGNAYGNIQRGLASGQRIFAILDQENEIKEIANPVPFHTFEKNIDFRNVTFSYASEPVLHDVNLTIPKGKMYALVGHSGAGKSTIADLIPRFYDITDGELCIDGVNVKNYKLNDLIDQMGIVTQEPVLFNDTVFSNIAFGMSGVSEEQVIAAAKIANADEFIIHLEDGYYTRIGDRGMRLSGGQRQRLAIARAVLKNPPILILDEATSALDTESERLVQDALTKLMANRTSLVIAHRLSTVKHADCICVLENGRIVEQGTHDELIAIEKGVYKYLHSLQVK